MKRFWFIATLCSLLLLPFFFQSIDLTTEDLGRHFKNGELVFQNPKLLQTNFYSYTQPAFAFINHHWLSGVAFFVLNTLVHIEGLVLLYAAMAVATLCILLKRMYNRAGLYSTALVAPLLTLFIAERHTVRPEGFGLLLLALFLLYLDRFEKRAKISAQSIFFLTLLTVLWVNLHISFIFGVFAVGSFALPQLILWFRTKKLSVFGKSLFILFGCMCLATLLNPNSIRGALYPLNIFTNYGYDIVENKSLTFLFSRIYDPGIYLYFVFAPLTLLALFIRLGMPKHRNIGELVRVFSGLVLGFVALRNLPIFAVFTLPFFAETVRLVVIRILHSKNARDSMRMFGLVCAGVSYFIIVLAVLTGTYHPSISLRSMKLGYVDHQFDSANFFKSLPLKGAMFNNYDIGSYLISTQFPAQPVFVDNRPEAYSYDFFKKTYIPMQEKDQDWQSALNTYDFQSIFFGYHDLTPWAQTFLSARLKDPAWKVVYIDELAIIFIRNSPEHAEVVAKYAVSPQDLAKYLRITP